MAGRRYSDGLHQAIEAKENVEVKRESRTFATITFQNYFRIFKKLAGMTGTAQTEAEEFLQIYGLETVVIPTNRPISRKDDADMVEELTECVDQLCEIVGLLGIGNMDEAERLNIELVKKIKSHATT